MQVVSAHPRVGGEHRTQRFGRRLSGLIPTLAGIICVVQRSLKRLSPRESGTIELRMVAGALHGQPYISAVLEDAHPRAARRACSSARARPPRSAHPRAGGEHLAIASTSSAKVGSSPTYEGSTTVYPQGRHRFQGSSPRWRGVRGLREPQPGPPRLIPAWAGSTVCHSSTIGR